MINFDGVAKKTLTKYYPNWPYTLDHLNSILIIEGSGSGKTNSIFNRISHQPNIHKIYLYAKDPYKAKR